MNEREIQGSDTRYLSVTIAVGVGLTLLFFRGLLPEIATHFPSLGFGDPYIQAWQIAWGGHALLTQPLDFFQANAFWPADDSLAFSDALLGFAPFGAIGEGVAAAILRYNLLFLFSYSLCFVATALLARECGVSWWAGWVGAAAFAFAPYRLDQNTHLHVVAAGGIPLSLFLMLRGYRRRKKSLIVAGWLTAAWQVSIGFTLGLPFTYLLFGGGLVLAAVGYRQGWVERQVVIASAIGVGAFLLWIVIQGLPYLNVSNEYDQAAKSISEVAFYSPPLSSFLSAPETSTLWSSATVSIRDHLQWPSEQSLFPGLLVIALALIGALGRVFPRWVKVTAGVSALIAMVLALGFKGPFGGRLYGYLYDLLPGWQAMRTPGRMVVFSTLALALLAAAGAQIFFDWTRRLTDRRITPAIAALLVCVVVLEGAGEISITEIPRSGGGFQSAEPQLHVPSDEFSDRLYMLWSVDGFPLMANGLASFTPDALAALREAVATFPSPDSVTGLRSAGISSVVIHESLLPEGADLTSILESENPGIRDSRREGDVVIARLQP